MIISVISETPGKLSEKSFTVAPFHHYMTLTRGPFKEWPQHLLRDKQYIISYCDVANDHIKEIELFYDLYSWVHIRFENGESIEDLPSEVLNAIYET